MATIKNSLLCSGSLGNRGTKICLTDKFQYFIGVIVTDTTQSFAEEDLTDLDTFLLALKKSQVADVSSRTYLFPAVDSFKDETEAPVITKTDSGLPSGKTEHPYSLTFSGTDEGFFAWKALRKFDNLNLRFYFITNTKGLIYKQLSDGSICGFQGNLMVQKPTLGDPKTPTITKNYTITLNSASALVDEGEMLSLGDIDLFSELHGINDLEIKVDSTSALSVVVSVLATRGNTNIGPTYGDLLVSNLWVLTDSSTGATSTPATVAYSDTTKKFTIGVASAFTGLLSLETPAKLLAANVGDYNNGGYESNEVSVVIPAT